MLQRLVSAEIYSLHSALILRTNGTDIVHVRMKENRNTALPTTASIQTQLRNISRRMKLWLLQNNFGLSRPHRHYASISRVNPWLLPGTIVLKSPTGSEMGKSTASKICVMKIHHTGIQRTKLHAPPAYWTAFISFIPHNRGWRHWQVVTWTPNASVRQRGKNKSRRIVQTWRPGTRARRRDRSLFEWSRPDRRMWEQSGRHSRILFSISGGRGMVRAGITHQRLNYTWGFVRLLGSYRSMRNGFP